MRHAGSLEHVLPRKLRVERESNFIPDGYVSLRTVVIRSMAALDVTKVTDIVNWAVGTSDGQRRLPGNRQSGTFGKEHVQDNAPALIQFPPHAEMPGEALAQYISRLNISLNCKTDCSGRPG